MSSIKSLFCKVPGVYNASVNFLFVNWLNDLSTLVALVNDYQNNSINVIFLHLKSLVIDIMVDPDGTLDALSSLGLTSPLMAENSVSPGSQGPAGIQAAEASAYSEVAERDLGLQEKSKEQNTAHQNWTTPSRLHRVLHWFSKARSYGLLCE